MTFDCSQTSGTFDIAHVQICFVQSETPFVQGKPGHLTLTPQGDGIDYLLEVEVDEQTADILRFGKSHPGQHLRTEFRGTHPNFAFSHRWWVVGPPAHAHSRLVMHLTGKPCV